MNAIQVVEPEINRPIDDNVLRTSENHGIRSLLDHPETNVNTLEAADMGPKHEQVLWVGDCLFSLISLPLYQVRRP